MKLIRLAPLALAVFSAAASADMFTANLYDVNNINQDVIDSRLSMSGPLFNGWDRTFKQGDPWVEAYGMTHRINRTGDFGKFKNKGAGGAFGYDHVIADNFRLGLALNGGAGIFPCSGREACFGSGSFILLRVGFGFFIRVRTRFGFRGDVEEDAQVFCVHVGYLLEGTCNRVDYGSRVTDLFDPENITDPAG